MVKERFIQLIDKYLLGTATDSEKQLVEEYLTRLEAGEHTNLDNEQERMLKETMWYQIQQKTIQKSAQLVPLRRYTRKTISSIAVAASIILVMGLGILYFVIDKPNQRPIVVQNDKRTDSSTLSFLYHEVNTTGKEKRIQLPDGTLIVLADKSEVTYRKPFGDRRDVTLEGKAFFKVAKDKTRPFTVNSGDISTTALGTEFTVTAFKNARQIIVRLYEGKVVVKPVDKGNKRMKSDVYLLPGQELVYGGPTVIVRKFKLNRHAAPEQTMDEELSRENPSIPENTKNTYFMFNNRPLEEVFDQLAEIYNVKIVYDKKDVKNLYFIGRYNSAASVETILKRIAILNNLTITKQDSAFIISR